jgi:MFS family permease
MALKILGKDGFYGWVILAVIFIFYIPVMLMMMAFGQFLPFWLGDFKSWSEPAIMGAQSVSFILTGLSAPIVGIYIMKWGARRAIIFGNTLNVIGLLLMSYQTKIWHLYIGAGVVLGLGMSIGGMLAIMTVINNWFIAKRSMALALSQASLGLSGFVFSPLMMKFITSYGWRPTSRIIAGLAFILCVLIPGLLIKNKPQDLGQVPDGSFASLANEMKPEEAQRKKPYTTPVDFTANEALRTWTLWLLVIYGTILFFTLNGLMPIQINYLIGVGFSKDTASWASGLMSLIMTFSALGMGLLGLRYSMHSLAIGSIIIAIAGYITILFAHSMPVVLAYCILLGVGFGIQSIVMGNLFPNYFGVSEFPKIMGFTMPFNTIISSFGAPVAGYIHRKTGSYIPAFRISIVLLAVALICIILAKAPVHPSLKKKKEPAQTAA